MKEELKKKLLMAQKSEITEYHIYHKLAGRTKAEKNAEVLRHIANEELGHYKIWKKHTGQEVRPNWIKVWFYYFVSVIFGLTFGLKLMERGEKKAELNYEDIGKDIENAKKILEDEHKHENKLINLLKEEKLDYVGSIVLGLNDALVELTGALAGLTLALQNARIIVIAGLITGVAASMSMAASEYLSVKAEAVERSALKSSVYTGIAYIFTVLFLIFPYLILSNVYYSLAWALINAVIVILFFTYYMAVAKDENFSHKFFEMAGISLGVAAISFGFGYLVRVFFGVDV